MKVKRKAKIKHHKIKTMQDQACLLSKRYQREVIKLLNQPLAKYFGQGATFNM